MARFLFLVLLVANLALAGHVYLSHQQPSPALPKEINPDQLKVVSITDSARAQRDAAEAEKLIASLTGATCAQFSVRPVDAPRAHTTLATLSLGDRLSSRNIEEFTRFGVAMPIQRDRRAADALLTSLKKANVKDVLIMADNSVSLGLFSSEDAAKRVLADLEAKTGALVKGITITPKNPQVRETAFVVRELDTTLITKLAVLQKDFEGSTLKGTECPGTATVATVSGAPAPNTAPTNAATAAPTPASTPAPPAAASAAAPTAAKPAAR
ncbi:MAG: hypothetical protein ACK50D_04220 [Burkholderiales bacterium]